MCTLEFVRSDLQMLRRFLQPLTATKALEGTIYRIAYDVQVSR